MLMAVGVMMVSVTGCAGDKMSQEPTVDTWKLAVQAYSFNRFTLFEAIEKADQAGIRYIEAYPNQVINKQLVDKKGKPTKLWFNASPEIRQQIKDKLKKHNVKLVNIGVFSWMPDNEPGMRQLFDFAKDMGIETIVCEPEFKLIPLVDKLAQEYKIKAGIHNHPKPSKYWNPDIVLKALEGTSNMMGVSGDTGHWCRSGLDPVEQVKKLEGRLISFHLKDLKDFGTKNTHDVPYGTGKAKVKEVLEELDKQGFEGVFSIEYEHNWDNSLPEIKKCAEYFYAMKTKLHR